MNERICITESDHQALQALVIPANNAGDSTTRDPEEDYLNRLKGELDRARIVPVEELPAGVITMYSRVELEDVSNGEIMTYTLVYPEEADVTEGRISILAPLGTGMLGYQAGDEFEWETPGGKMRLKVRGVTLQSKSSLGL